MTSSEELRPRIFLASSKEARDAPTTLMVRDILEQRAYVRPWWDADLWRTNESTFHNLIRIAKYESDACVAIFLPQDQTIIRNEKSFAVRDNVVFEFALFTGIQGKRNTAIVEYPKEKSSSVADEHPDIEDSSPIRLATDLLGITTVRVSPGLRARLEVQLNTWLDDVCVQQEPNTSTRRALRDALFKVDADHADMWLEKLGIDPRLL